MAPDVMQLGAALRYYKRPEIQRAIFDGAENREVVGSFGGKGYAKRPDILQFPADVLEQVRNGVTSFHASEEGWSDPLRLKPGMRRQDQDELRSGWDLVLDIDCPVWELSKMTTWLFYKALKAHDIGSVSVKFSGNKGFHIGVPFKAFPEIFRDQVTRTMFPDAARAIALYLLNYIENRFIDTTQDKIIFGDPRHSYSFEQIQELTGKKLDELTKSFCARCDSPVKGSVSSSTQFVCSRCSRTADSDDEYKSCDTCNVLMEKIETRKPLCRCGSFESLRRFDPLSIIEVDTVLISPRHLYRMTYSMNEKSGLVSVPIDPIGIVTFDKTTAQPDNVQVSEYKFLDDSSTPLGEAKNLLSSALDFIAAKKVDEERRDLSEKVYTSEKKFDSFETVQEAIPEQCFPPCFLKMMEGMSDGRKRAMFAYVNFLSSVGWQPDNIDEQLAKWNEKNPEPLREVMLKGQVRYHKMKKKSVPPPNCRSFYEDLRICCPDRLCDRVKNPVSYAIRKGRSLQVEKHQAKKGEEVDSTPKDSSPTPSHEATSDTPNTHS